MYTRQYIVTTHATVSNLGIQFGVVIRKAGTILDMVFLLSDMYDIISG